MRRKRRRILYIEKPTSIGGSVISLYELIRDLDITLFEPVVLFHGPNPYREQLRAIGVDVITLSEQKPQVVSARSSRDIAASLSNYSQRLSDFYRAAKEAYLIINRDLPIARQVASLIKDKAIDLVHHNNSLPKNRDTIMAGRLAGVPQVCHVRMLHKFSFWERYLARSVNTFIYISRAVEQHYQKLGISQCKGEVVYNPFDFATYAKANHSTDLRSEFGLTDRDLLVSNVGRLDWWKGQDDFLRALAEVIPGQPTLKALIVGSSDASVLNQKYYQELQQLVANLQLSDHVVFTGFRSDIPRIMAASDIVVHSASEPEPFGRVVVEGMAAGRPVIATAAGGVLDIVEDQVTGLLVPPRNPSLMAKAIRQLLQNREQASIIGQQAQKRARERFSVEQHVAAIQRIYHKVLASASDYGSVLN